jgi:CubicO group peptidase (beta-lactamase class C family)
LRTYDRSHFKQVALVAATCILSAITLSQCLSTDSNLSDSSSVGDGTAGQFDRLSESLQAQMAKYQVPGLSIAVTYREKLVYAASFGVADLNLATPIGPQSLFRIASVSKPITEIAILKLCAANKLRLDQTVFGKGGVLESGYAQPPDGSMIGKITIRNLLEHKSGWTNVPNDPMFNYPNMSQHDLINLMINTRPLSTTPGTSYYYLNFGYCVLGRIIEQVTSIKYADYVAQQILDPCGISDMQIGRNAKSDAAPGEVTYYQKEFSPYRLDVERMDSHGGWIASAIDLSDLLTHIDREPRVADIIDSRYLQGTYFDYLNWYATGSLPGTSAILCRLNDEVNFALLANTRTESGPNQILNDLYASVSSELSAIRDWPQSEPVKDIGNKTF